MDWYKEGYKWGKSDALEGAPDDYDYGYQLTADYHCPRNWRRAVGEFELGYADGYEVGNRTKQGRN